MEKKANRRSTAAGKRNHNQKQKWEDEALEAAKTLAHELTQTVSDAIQKALVLSKTIPDKHKDWSKRERRTENLRRRTDDLARLKEAARLVQEAEAAKRITRDQAAVLEAPFPHMIASLEFILSQPNNDGVSTIASESAPAPSSTSNEPQPTAHHDSHLDSHQVVPSTQTQASDDNKMADVDDEWEQDKKYDTPSKRAILEKFKDKYYDAEDVIAKLEARRDELEEQVKKLYQRHKEDEVKIRAAERKALDNHNELKEFRTEHEGPQLIKVAQLQKTVKDLEEAARYSEQLRAVNSSDLDRANSRCREIEKKVAVWEGRYDKLKTQMQALELYSAHVEEERELANDELAKMSVILAEQKELSRHYTQNIEDMAFSRVKSQLNRPQSPAKTSRLNDELADLGYGDDMSTPNDTPVSATVPEHTFVAPELIEEEETPSSGEEQRLRDGEAGHGIEAVVVDFDASPTSSTGTGSLAVGETSSDQVLVLDEPTRLPTLLSESPKPNPVADKENKTSTSSPLIETSPQSPGPAQQKTKTDKGEKTNNKESVRTTIHQQLDTAVEKLDTVEAEKPFSEKPAPDTSQQLPRSAKQIDGIDVGDKDTVKPPSTEIVQQSAKSVGQTGNTNTGDMITVPPLLIKDCHKLPDSATQSTNLDGEDKTTTKPDRKSTEQPILTDLPDEIVAQTTATESTHQSANLEVNTTADQIPRTHEQVTAMTPVTPGGTKMLRSKLLVGPLQAFFAVYFHLWLMLSDSWRHKLPMRARIAEARIRPVPAPFNPWCKEKFETNIYGHDHPSFWFTVWSFVCHVLIITMLVGVGVRLGERWTNALWRQANEMVWSRMTEDETVYSLHWLLKQLGRNWLDKKQYEWAVYMAMSLPG